jgi:hypothetical protein
MIEFFVIIVILGIMVYLFIRLRRRGSSSATFMITQGATDAFLDNDKKRATEIIVEQNAGKKMEEQGSTGTGPSDVTRSEEAEKNDN